MQMKTFSSKPVSFLAGTITFITEKVAFGCASCTGAIPEPIRQAYNYSTLWLSFVPVIFMGSVVYFIHIEIKRKRAKNK